MRYAALPDESRQLLVRRWREGMKTRMVVFATGIATIAFGCATQELHDDLSVRVRVASYSSPASAQSSWYGAITVSPEQVFED
jgi:hypothetical protein